MSRIKSECLVTVAISEVQPSPPVQYEFSNLVSEDNSGLEDRQETDRGVYWTQEEGAGEDNPGAGATDSLVEQLAGPAVGTTFRHIAS